MIDGRGNNEKGFMSIAYDTYKDFAENTSIHGLKYTVKHGIVLYERIFWTLVVLLGLLGAGYMTVLFWNRYTSNPTRTSIKTDFAPTTSVPFPAVTICNINRIIANKVDIFVERLVMPKEQTEIARRALPQLLALTNPTSRPYNTTELAVLHEILIRNDYTTIESVMRRVTQSCEEMLIKCKWNFDIYECGELFAESLSIDGICCSFNYIRHDSKKNNHKTPIYSPFSGFDSGLVLLLDPMLQPVQYAALHSAGLKVFIHSPDDYPGSGTVYKIVSAGRLSLLQITAWKIVCSNEIRRLAIEQRECAYEDELTLQYFNEYKDTNCLVECEALFFYSRCGCVPFYYVFTDKPICNTSHISCMDKSKSEKIDINFLRKVAKKCNCPSQCEDEFYKVLSTTTKYIKDDDSIKATSLFKIEKNMSDDTIMLMVYFSGQTHTILYKDAITSTIYLLSSFGGVYSLFLGCSFITIIEIIYYCTFRLIVNCKLVGRIDKTPNSPKKGRKRPNPTVRTIQLWNDEKTFYLN